MSTPQPSSPASGPNEPGRPLPAWFDLRLIAPAIAACVVLFVLGALRLNRGPDWILVGRSGSGTATLAELPIPAANPGPVRLDPGHPMVVDGDLSLDLVCPRTVALQVGPGSRLSVPTSPGRWVARAVGIRATQGTLRFTTGPDFPGRLLVVTTPHGDLVVSGTPDAVNGATLALEITPDSTAVSVLHGTVGFMPISGTAPDLPPGTRTTYFGPGPEPVGGALPARSRGELEGFREAWVGRL